MPPVAIIGGAMLAGTIVNGIAQSNAANAQASAANNALSLQEQSQQKAESLAAPSFQDMQQIQQQYTMSNQLLTTQISQLQQQQQLFNSVNTQANNLINGGTNNAYTAQRAQQQAQFENQLMQQLGPGYAATSAGQQALNNFQLQTEVGQQQIAGQYTQMAGQLGSQITAGYNQTYQTAGQLNASGLSADQGNRTLQVQALTNNQPNYNNSIATAGAPYAGMAAIGSGIASAGALMGASMLKPAASPAPSSGTL